MELETFWDEELPSDNDDRISKLEAEIAETKALLSRLSQDDDLF